MELSSPSFGEGDLLPSSHAAEGGNLSPPLAWSDLPHGTRSLALVMVDLDAPAPVGPRSPYTHWIVYNLQPSLRGLPLGTNRSGLPPGARPGRNDAGGTEWRGPDPQRGPHRYCFRLFALDATLDPAEVGTPDLSGLLAAIEDHVLAEARVHAIYQREGAPFEVRPAGAPRY
jgi:hypothetical protein